MSLPEDTEDPLDRELLSEQLVGTALRGRLALVTGHDEAVSALLGELAVELADSTEVARLDASVSHKPASLVRALITPLNVEPDELLSALHQRADTVPLVLVIDNGECLGSEALHALRALVSKSKGGLGVILGGEEELAELLAEVDLAPAFRAAAGDAEPEANTGEPAGPSQAAELARLLPWKHLAAVTGLLLLIWLFWPAPEQPARQERSAELSLPAPAEKDTPPEPAPDDRDAEPTAPAETDTPAVTPPSPETADTVERAEPAPDNEVTEPSSSDTDTEAASAPEDRDARSDASGEPELSGLDAELGYHREDWLLTRAPDDWMLQLALAGDERRARTLLDQLGRDRGAYYRARRDGETVYVLLAGPYGSREEALGARETLPAGLRDTGPFPRSLKAIAEEIHSS